MRTRILKQRMASDTDLWMSVKAAQAKYHTTLETTTESPTQTNPDGSHSSETSEVVLNPLDEVLLQDPSNTIADGMGLRKRSAPSPSNKRVLTQEEFDKCVFTILS